MTITRDDAAQALRILRGAGIAGLRDADPDVWAMVVNAAPLTVTSKSGRQPVTDERGDVVRLDPQPGEVAPAATRMASLGVSLPQAADLAAAIQDGRDGDRAARNARILADAERHGPLLPDGLGGEPEAEIAWRRAATAAVGAGASRSQAVAHAWRAIGRTPPARQVAGGAPEGRERARAVIATLAAGRDMPGKATVSPVSGRTGVGWYPSVRVGSLRSLEGLLRPREAAGEAPHQPHATRQNKER